jgi:site-specific recombinase XerD
MGEKEISEFLTHLAVEENVAASTQNQALSALLFLYRDVLRKDLDLPLELVWAKRPKRLPTVLTKEEIQQVIAQLTGVHRLIVQLLYGSGLRLMECMRLRVKDLDFGQRQILVRDTRGEGPGDRLALQPRQATACPIGHSQAVARTGPGRRVRGCLLALCPGTEISACEQRMDLAVCFP